MTMEEIICSIQQHNDNSAAFPVDSVIVLL